MPPTNPPRIGLGLVTPAAPPATAPRNGITPVVTGRPLPKNWSSGP